MRIGLVGCGRWGRYILRDLISLGCDVTVVARSPESKARATAGGADSIVETVGELRGVSGIVVATPTSTHAAVIEQALAFDVPVFGEKPLTDDPKLARALAELAGDRLFVMDKWRYHRGIEALAAMARTGEYGSLKAIHSRRLSWGHDHDDVDAVWILIPHDLAIVREIAGSLPAVVGAVGTIWSKKFGSLTAMLGPEPACTIEISSVSLIRERRVAVHFEDAVAQLTDAYSPSLEIVRLSSGESITVPLADDMPLMRELAAFVDHLTDGPAPRSSAAEGAEAVERIAELRALAGI
ncbi:MAG: Gfo/Idh/MocA family oxidoreductase [Ilumatobacteraceae bacterium]